MMTMPPTLRGVLVYGNTLAAVAVAAATVVVLNEANSSTSEAIPLNSNAVVVSSSGSAEAPGTKSSPTTLASAIDKIPSGGTIYLRGGTYPFSRTVTIAPGNNGTSRARKTLSAYPGETPVLDFSAMTEEPTNRGLAVNGSFWSISGLVVEHAGDNGIFIGGSNNVIERAVTRFNHDSGLQISRISPSTPRSQWPSNNLVVSTESYDNADSDGEDADGFAAKLTVGPGNIFRHNVSHNNIDDGWDLYTKTRTGPIAPVTIEDSLSFDNGTLSNGTRNTNGDRNGFNLGGSGVAVDHIVRRSIAYHNGKHGFTYNMNPGSIAMTGNISIDNRQRNYSFEQGTHTFRSNTSCRSVRGPNDKIVGSIGRSNLFWSRSARRQCSSVTGRLKWSFDSSGRLAVAFGDKTASTLAPMASAPAATSTTTPNPNAPAASGTLLDVDFEDGDTSDWAMTGGS